MSTYNKEASKISFMELAPSLQAIISGKADVTLYNNTKTLINTIYAREGKLTITAGISEPVSGVYQGADGKPLVIANDLAVHLNTSKKVIEYYHDNVWNKHRLIYNI